MSAKADLPVWYAVDEGGDYAVGIDRETAIDAYYSEFDGTITRVFKVIAKGVTLVPCVEVEVVVPDQAGEIESAGVEQLDCPVIARRHRMTVSVPELLGQDRSSVDAEGC